MKLTDNRLHRDEVLHILGLHRDELAERYGVTGLGIFGSVVRDEANEASDINIVVETRVPDLLRMVNLKEDLEHNRFWMGELYAESKCD